LLDEINSLSSPSTNTGVSDPQVLGLNSFVLAASFYLQAYKVYAIFVQKGGCSFNRDQCNFVLSQITTWTSYVQGTLASIQSQIQAQLQQVSPVTPFTLGAVSQGESDLAGLIPGLANAVDGTVGNLVPQQSSLVYFAYTGETLPQFTFTPPAGAAPDG